MDERFHVGQDLLCQFGAVEWHEDALIYDRALRLPGPHQQHRTRGTAQHLVGYVAEDPAADAGAAVRRHRDQVRPHFACEGEYLIGRPAEAHVDLHLGSGRLESRCHSLQVLLQLALDAPLLLLCTGGRRAHVYESWHNALQRWNDREQMDEPLAVTGHLCDVRQHALGQF